MVNKSNNWNLDQKHLERVSFLLEVSFGFLSSRQKVSQDLRKEAWSHTALHKVVSTEIVRVR